MYNLHKNALKVRLLAVAIALALLWMLAVGISQL